VCSGSTAVDDSVELTCALKGGQDSNTAFGAQVTMKVQAAQQLVIQWS